MLHKACQLPSLQPSVIWQVYSLFQDNYNYQLLFPSLKKKIQNCDHPSIVIAVRSLRRILASGTPLTSKEIAASQNLAATNPKPIILNEYSKLLAMRFIRQTYFDSNYLYMTYVLLYLSSVLLRIAEFMKESSDEERGRHLFRSDSRVFEGEVRTGLGEKELEVIGFSIHKLTMEVMFACRDYVKCLPNHEQFIKGENEAMQAHLNNPLYAGYLLLKENRVKFPTKFHYFKEKDISKYTAYYQRNSNNLSIKELYSGIFDAVWKRLQQAIDRQQIQENVDGVFLIDTQEVFLQERLMFCERLVLQTFDRFFWKHFNEFVHKKLSSIKLGQSLSEDQLREVLCIHLFILLFTYRLLQPEIMHLLQHNFIEKMANLFVAVLRSYGRVNEERKIEGIVLVGKTLDCLIDCFGKMKQLSIQFAHHFNQKHNTVHSYHLISFYADIVLHVETTSPHPIRHPFSQEIEKDIITRMGSNHEFHFRKHEFLFYQYQKKEQSLIDSPKESFSNEVQATLAKYSKYLRTKQTVPIEPITEQIVLDKQEISKEQLHIVPHRQKSSNMKSSFRLKLLSPEKNEFPQQKHSTLEIKSAITTMKRPSDGKIPSFVESLKVKINKPSDELVKSLSSSRKLRRFNNESSSQIRSFRSNDHSDHSETSLFLAKNNAIPPFTTPPQFKHVFIENHDLPVFEQPLESRFSSARKTSSKLQRVGRGNEVNTRYINNFIEQGNIESKKIIDEYNNEAVKEIKEKERKVETEYLPQQPKSQKIPSVSSMSSLDKLSFYFTPKVKKQLLKKKVLIRKQTSLQIGMIANLQQQITTNESQRTRKYLLLIKIYITALVPLTRVTVNVKMPNWLECVSKANLFKEGLKEQSQFTSNFVVMLKANRQHVPKRNYGEMPILNVVWVDRNEKKEIVSQPLYVLLNRFAIEKGVTESEFNEQLLASWTVSDPLPIHEKIAVDLKGIRNYYSSLSTFSLDIPQKMNLFSDIGHSVSDELGIMKLQFVRNHQQLMLIFFEGELTPGKNRLFVQFHPLKPALWAFEDLHTFLTCLRSILRADQ